MRWHVLIGGGLMMWQTVSGYFSEWGIEEVVSFNWLFY